MRWGCAMQTPDAIPRRTILIEGLTPAQIVALDELEDLAATGEPIIFRAGSAELLAQFSIKDRVLKAELAVVERGGEGVLPVLVRTVERAAARRSITAIEWWVYARDCADPNPKLAPLLQRLGFEVRPVPGGGEFYWRRVSTNDRLGRMQPDISGAP